VFRGLRFLELFRRNRRFEERLSALQESLDGGEPQAALPPPRPGDARAELLIGLHDDLDMVRARGVRSVRLGIAVVVVAAIFASLAAPGIGVPLLFLALGLGWIELKRFRRIRTLQRLIERESSSPTGSGQLSR